MPRKIIRKESETFSDSTTGKTFAKYEKSLVSIPQEPAYVKLYLDAVLYLSDVPEGITAVLYAILPYVPYADNPNQIFSLPKPIKKQIADRIGRSERYVKDAIISLVKGRVLIHDDSSPRSTCYSMNPYIFARGNWKDIEELRLHVNFNAHGKTFWTEVKNADGSISSSEPRSALELLIQKAKATD